MFVTRREITVNKQRAVSLPALLLSLHPRLFSPCSNMFSVLLNKVEIIHEKRINKGPFQSWVMYAGMHPMLSPNASAASAASASAASAASASASASAHMNTIEHIKMNPLRHTQLTAALTDCHFTGINKTCVFDDSFPAGPLSEHRTGSGPDGGPDRDQDMKTKTARL